MKFFWVGFAPYSPTGDQHFVSQGAWVSVEEFDADKIEAEARRRLSMPEEVTLTTMVEFSQEDYDREKARERAYKMIRDPQYSQRN